MAKQRKEKEDKAGGRQGVRGPVGVHAACLSAVDPLFVDSTLLEGAKRKADRQADRQER